MLLLLLLLLLFLWLFILLSYLYGCYFNYLFVIFSKAIGEAQIITMESILWNQRNLELKCDILLALTPLWSIEESFGIRWEETILLKSQSFQKLSQPNPTTFFQWWYYCQGHIGSAAKNSPSFVFFTCAWLLIAHYQSDWSAKIRAKKNYCRRVFFPQTLAILCRFPNPQLETMEK